MAVGAGKLITMFGVPRDPAAVNFEVSLSPIRFEHQMSFFFLGFCSRKGRAITCHVTSRQTQYLSLLLLVSRRWTSMSFIMVRGLKLVLAFQHRRRWGTCPFAGSMAWMAGTKTLPEIKRPMRGGHSPQVQTCSKDPFNRAHYITRQCRTARR